LNILFPCFALLFFPGIFCLVALAITVADGRPALYRQQRMGRDFRTFGLLKLRTMRVGADRSNLLTLADDERITRMGRFLRKYKLDELPQLINVLKGEMQLVGPRPEVQRYVEMFPAEYAVLLQEPPGLTDPASLAYIDESSHFSGTEDIERKYVTEILPHKLKLSLEYQQRRTFFSDIGVILQTLARLFSFRSHDGQPALRDS
jgi:lipopolysaccharide/colanic/teichoic acid biosynthesis glycosyltransferase